MGKKTKVGKQRKDKYYRLAKECGYRSRAAFKLVQLNKKYEFLQKSQVLVDLCAAPGGWMQVAKQFMPISSLIIGVDLVPIRPIPNALTLQGDITTDSCKKAIQNELKTWLADVVLHDGAPNVGQNWIHDAFMQAQLTLSALRLATTILRKGGWFVTKVFRSKDYSSLIPVFGKLFSKVHVTKPVASRNESAEIFVICQGYLKPERPEPGLLDMQNVFSGAQEDSTSTPKNILAPGKPKKAKAEGYAEGKLVLSEALPASQFIRAENYLELLSQATLIVLDDKRVIEHATTTPEIKECCKDIRVLGRKELRELLNWRKELRKILVERLEKAPEASETVVITEEDLIAKEIGEAKADELQQLKKKKRKELKEKSKLREKLKLQMIIPGDRPDFPDLDELFDIGKIRTSKQLESIVDVPVPDDDTNYEEILDDNDEVEVDSVEDANDDENETTFKKLPLSDFASSTRGALVVDLDNATALEKNKRTVQNWFARESFANVDLDDDEDYDFQELTASHVPPKSEGKKKLKRVKTEETNVNSSLFEKEAAGGSDDDLKAQASASSAVSDHQQAEGAMLAKKPRLDVEALALAEELIYSSKTRRDIIDWGYNRFTNNDGNLPDWFMEDEKKHCKKQLPITKERVEELKSKMVDIDARPIKRVLEAKARKKKRAMKRLDRVRKKADGIAGNPDKSEKEKALELKKLYKQSVDKKPNVKYIVAKKGQVGKRVGRPKGVGGRFKMVDPRMKKDLRKMKNSNRKQQPKKR